jgi:hypothetical protein
MDLGPGLQRALDRVELVGGSIGDPGQGRMCLMSLVAFLAGEGHSDAPGCASPLVQAFAVAANDHMPRAARRRLEPFAPRTIGTHDGFDGPRAAVLRRALAEEIPPEAPAGRRPAGHGAPAKGGSPSSGGCGAGCARTDAAACSTAPRPATTASTWRGRRRA